MTHARTFFAWMSVFLLAGFLVISEAGAGVVRTFDGKIYEGDVAFNPDGTLRVQKKNAQPVSIPLEDVLDADFKAQSPAPLRPAIVDDRLPAPWQSFDIGRSAVPGTARRDVDGVFYIKGSGGAMDNRSDSCFFVAQPLTVDQQIVIHLRSIQGGNPRSKIGLMVREGLETTPREAFLMFMGGKYIRLCGRAEHGVNEFTIAGGATAVCDDPWFLLSRRGKTISASQSVDGLHWSAIGHLDLLLLKDVRIGIWLTSSDPNTLVSAIIDHVSVGPVVDNPQVGTPPQTINSARGVVLKSGTAIGDATLSSLTGQTVRFTDAHGKLYTVPLSEISRLTFVPLSAAALMTIPEHLTGVLKPGGDFLEGDFLGFDGQHVKISSVLFGPQSLLMRDEAAALVLRDVEPIPSPLVVRTTAGSLFLAKSVQLDKDNVLIDDVSVGQVSVPQSQILEIKAGATRIDRLDTFKPLAIEAPTDVSSASAFSAGGLVAGQSITLGGRPIEHALLIAANTSVKFRLDARYKLLLFRPGIPDAVLPAVSARIVVLADNKEIYRGPALTSVDDPAMISLPLSGAKTLTLRVESPPGIPCPLICADAQLVK